MKVKRAIFEKAPPYAVIIGWFMGLINTIMQGGTAEEVALYLVPAGVFLIVQFSKYFGVTGDALKWFSYVVSLVIAGGVLALKGQLPVVNLPLDNPAEWVAGLLTLATAIAGFASVIYEALNSELPAVVKSDRDIRQEKRGK